MTVSQVRRQCLDNLPIIYQKDSSRGFVAYFPARRYIVPRPFASPVVLPNEIRQQLQTLVRAASTPQALAFRCRLILHAATDDNPTNQQLAEQLHCDRHTVGQ
jgi:hypothetical protein